MRLVAVVLAAGESSRYGSQKLRERIDETSVLDRVLRVAERFGEVVLVVNPTYEELGIDLSRFDLVINHNWRDGISTSVRLGIKRAAEKGSDAVLIFLGDMPFLSGSTVEDLLERSKISERSILYPVYRGMKGFPTLVKKEAFDLVNTLKGDEGFRKIIRDFPDICEGVDVDDPGCVLDIDTPDDLEKRWEGDMGWST